MKKRYDLSDIHWRIVEEATGSYVMYKEAQAQQELLATTITELQQENKRLNDGWQDANLQRLELHQKLQERDETIADMQEQMAACADYDNRVKKQLRESNEALVAAQARIEGENDERI